MCIHQRVNNTASASALNTSSCASDQGLQHGTETDVPTLMEQTRSVGGFASMCRQRFQTFQFCSPHSSSSCRSTAIWKPKRS